MKLIIISLLKGKLKPKFKILLRLIVVPVIWGYCIYEIYNDFDHNFWFRELGHRFHIILASAISLLFVLIDYRQYRLQEKTPLIVSTSLIATFVFALCITSYKLDQQDKTATVLYASKTFNNWNSISLDFRENGTYKCGKSSFLGDEYYIRGQYTMKDSIIYLDKSNLFDLVTTDKLMIKTFFKSTAVPKKTLLDALFGRSKSESTLHTFLYQVHYSSDTINSAVVFEVNRDFSRGKNF